METKHQAYYRRKKERVSDLEAKIKELEENIKKLEADNLAKYNENQDLKSQVRYFEERGNRRR